MTSNNYHILVIDDMSDIHDDFRKILTPQRSQSDQNLEEMNTVMLGKTEKKTNIPPFELDFAFQGQEGVTRVQQSVLDFKPYAIAFVDVQMPPGMDGVEAIERMWKIDPEIQIVICTAYAKYSWEQIQQRLGDSDRLYILKKPFEQIEILNLANTLTKKWNLNRIMNEQLLELKKVPTSHAPENDINSTFKKLNETIEALKKMNIKLSEDQNKMFS